LSFIQASPRQKLRGVASLVQKTDQALSAEYAHKVKVVDTLMAASQRLKSPELQLIALRVTADPFKKVKKLIQELIERLVTQAAEEATQKGWCDTEMGKATSNRDNTMQKVSVLNAETANLEAIKEKLEEETSVLRGEISELQSALSKQTKIRTTDKLENMETIDTAKDGLAAVKDAYDVLKSFYKSAKKAKVSLVQKHGGPYKGNQAKGGSILSMLEVIIGDFERTVRVTTKAEKTMKREFVQFETTTKASIATKDTVKANKEMELADTTLKIKENMANLAKQQMLLDDSLKELEDLKPACVDTGMSYEERVAKRKEEMESLKTALCTLDPDKVEDECQ